MLRRALLKTLIAAPLSFAGLKRLFTGNTDPICRRCKKPYKSAWEILEPYRLPYTPNDLCDKCTLDEAGRILSEMLPRIQENVRHDYWNPKILDKENWS